jgi:hypothetical protein
MTKCILLAMLTAMVTVSSMQTKAQDATTVADVRCVMIGLQIYDSSDSAPLAAAYLARVVFILRHSVDSTRVNFSLNP